MLTTSAIFKDGMVLQRNAKVSIFGKTDCTSVEVSFNGKTYGAKVENGQWIAKVETADSGQNLSMSIYGKKDIADKEEKIEISDILLGDVWLAGGQSNMELELRNSLDGEAVAASADYDLIRFYNVPKIPTSGDELEEAEKNTGWNRIKGDPCRYMSAVAFNFAKEVHKETGVPIGIIDCYWGGTSATCWVDRETLADVDEVQNYIAEWDEICSSMSDEEYQIQLDEYNAKVNKWIEIEAEVKKANPKAGVNDVVAKAGDFPWPPPKGSKAPFRPFGLHNSMIQRIAPYTIKGIIYYQAEEDVDRAEYYSKLNSAVIKQWRKDFTSDEGGDEIPFYLTQLPMFISRDCEDDRRWCILRQQQKLCSTRNSNTGIAVIADCGEYDNIHPIDKETPGIRLARQVLAKTYNSDAGAENMELLQSVFEENRCEITFENTYSAICYRPTDGVVLTSRVNESVELEDNANCTDKLYGFEVSNDGENFYAPDIVADGNRLILAGDTGKAITDVRYGWFNYGVVNVYSKAGIPLMPFWIKND